MDELLGNYRALISQIDAHSNRVAHRWEESLACRRACTGCCHRALSVFPVEAAAIRTSLGDLATSPRQSEEPAPPEELVHPLTVLGDNATIRCAFLDGGGSCRIYAFRPVICRSHGLPIVVRVEDELHGDSCPLNFSETGLEDVPPSDFLNLDTVNTTLAAINVVFSRATGCAAGERISLSRLAAEEFGLSGPDESPGSS